MKISELIADLEKAKIVLGDVEVTVCDDQLDRTPSVFEEDGSIYINERGEVWL